MPAVFDHEKLNVYQSAIAFCGWVGELLATISAKAAVKDQIDRASTSIPLNIAEGNAKYSIRDRLRYFDIARGSALECAACLDVMAVRKIVDHSLTEEPKECLRSIVSMLMGMSKSLETRVREDEQEYMVPGRVDQD